MPGGTDAGLLPGDVVRSLNRDLVASLPEFRAAVDVLAPGAPVVLQIERQGRLRYLAFEMEWRT